MSNPESLVVPGPVVLIVRDGWGANPNDDQDEYNAVLLASKRGLTPVADNLNAHWPGTLIKTSGEDVGLPEGTMGNSEVGHQNIGAGRIVDQESVAITKACRVGLDGHQVLEKAILKAKTDNTYVHLMGLASDAGVHAQLEHLYGILRLCKQLGQEKVAVHLFTDGRDTGPFTGLRFVEQVESTCEKIGYSPSPIASIMGRFWSMDRDHRWERVHRAYAALTGRSAHEQLVGMDTSAQHCVGWAYEHPLLESQLGDEFIPPTMIGPDSETIAKTRIKDGDTVIFYNYRGDRPRELSAAMVYPDELWNKSKPSPDSGAIGFDRGAKLALAYVTMTAYSEELNPFVQVAFPKPPRMKNILGEYLSEHGISQYRCAETEKYPHVTFFFNDYRDAPFPGEHRENPQSPKVATYDLKPEMSAKEICDDVLARLNSPDCEKFLAVNFANGDMVGHTGNLEAAIKACATVDECVGKIMKAVLDKGGALIITADHGNCEQMFDPDTNSPHTAHTVYDVPLYIVSNALRTIILRGDSDVSCWYDARGRAKRGRLADIAPTVLELLGLTQPSEMTGTSLIVKS